MDEPEQIRIGTRGSPLALAQAEMVGKALAKPFEIVVIKTTGDHILDRPLAQVGGKGLFTKEIEEQLISGNIDIAVHSMKDMPTVLPEGLAIRAMLPRADPSDALISPSAQSIAELKEGAHIGTASLRRAAQVKALRPDLRISNLRGSVQTRLKRIEEGAFDATFLAKAGLDRLGLPENTGTALAPSEMLPAVAQGAIGVECAIQRQAIVKLLENIDHPPTSLCVEAERAFLAELDGSCRTPIAAYATLDNNQLTFRGLVLRPDGSESHARHGISPASEGKAMAAKFGQELKTLIGPDFFAH